MALSVYMHQKRGHKCPPYGANLQTTSLINKYCAGDVTSVAMDGVAPDLGQDCPVEGKTSPAQYATRKMSAFMLLTYAS